MRRPAELRSAKPLLWSAGTGADVWAMFQAAASGDVAALRRLLKKDPALVRAHYEYRTPLYFAVRENRLRAAALLLDFPGDALSLAVNDTLLTTARDRGYADMLRLLEERVGGEGEPVAAAIREKNLRQARRLLDASPALVHARDERGNQPIHWAAMTRQLKAIDELLLRGADIESKRPDGSRPLHLGNGDYLYRAWRDVPASTRTQPRAVLNHLLAKGAYCDICTACAIGDIDRVRELLAGDPTLVNRLSESGNYYGSAGSPLRNAARGGHIAIVRLLLERGADPNLPEEGIAPLGHALYEAVNYRHREVAELLLAHGARPNVPIESSADTLTAAIRNNDQATIDLLASYGAARALHILSYYGDIVTAAAMLSANPKLANDTIALTQAAEEGQEAVVRLLLRYSPGLPKKVGIGGSTPVITELLFAHGMNANHRDWLGATPLHHFAARGDRMNAELYLDRGAKIDALEEDLCSTPLGWAARNGRTEMVEFLLNRGAGADLPRDPVWARPIEWARRRGHREICKLLSE